MKKIFITTLFCCITIALVAQKKPATKPQRAPSQAEIDKMMNDAMKGMSNEDAAKMKEMMKQQQGKLQTQQPVVLDEVLSATNN
ncbi:MAG: hypothetical protein U5M51_09290 [Emticicia sp.]|nr:hypothetical protein [Emticicia sp.]